jgi:hypothetical protein
MIGKLGLTTSYVGYIILIKLSNHPTRRKARDTGNDEMATYTEWLNELKAGDAVLYDRRVSRNSTSRSVEEATVSRITATLYILSNNRKMRRCDGTEVGDRMSWLTRPSKE